MTMTRIRRLLSLYRKPAPGVALAVVLTSSALVGPVNPAVAADRDNRGMQRGPDRALDVGEFASVEEAVEKVSAVLEKRRFKIELVVNHQAAAGSVGLDLGPTQVIYATPPAWLTKRLLSRSKTIGIDLPLKFLIYENDDGQIELRYNTIGYLIDRHGGNYDPVFRALDYINGQFGRPDDGLTVIQSSLDPTAAIAAIKAALVANGAFRIPLELDFPSTSKRQQKLIVFGNPNAGTPLM